MKNLGVKLFAKVEVGGRTIHVFRQTYVNKKKTKTLMEEFLKNFVPENDDCIDFLIIEKGDKVTYCHKLIGIEGTLSSKNIEIAEEWRKAMYDENGNIKPTPMIISGGQLPHHE